MGPKDIVIKMRLAGLHLNIKTKIMTAEEIPLTQTMRTVKLLKILLTLLQSSIQIEITAKKSRED